MDFNNAEFIDWLSVKQSFNDLIPVFRSSIVFKIDDETGETVFQKDCFGVHEGSYDTRINILSDGLTLYISGNPSRIGRIDNVFGLTRIEQCIYVYNNILSRLGLPSLEYGKAEITRIDITKNYAVGTKNVDKFIRSVSSSMMHGQSGYLYSNGKTADWFRNSRHMYAKIYCKYTELLLHKKSKLNVFEQKYYNDLLKQVQDVGLCRLEIEFKSKLLKAKGLTLLRCNMTAEIINLFKDRNVIENIDTSISIPKNQHIVELLLEKEICKTKSSANHYNTIYQSWLNGHDLKANYSKAQFYKIRKKLLLINIDISEKCNAQNINTSFKTMEVIELYASDEYIRNSMPVLRLGKF
ncbi:MAG: phage/plasmid replication protein, II/X family [Gammaproteobacteria bacterium]|nr:phage/plasmid replication protein, II/X family [Gammaproteobacteria bacterium]MDH5629892.1 phage/plasmid replication protein, II/X family [Gammaproteobacteria bacterium]